MNNYTPTTIEIGNSKITNVNDIANAFNNYFASIGSTLANAIPAVDCSFEKFLKRPLCNSFLLFPTTTIEIKAEINNLNQTKSTGPFSIPTNY